jgi:hypothetical protein
MTSKGITTVVQETVVAAGKGAAVGAKALAGEVANAAATAVATATAATKAAAGAACPFRKSHPAETRVTGQNHRIVYSDVFDPARARNICR